MLHTRKVTGSVQFPPTLQDHHAIQLASANPNHMRYVSKAHTLMAYSLGLFFNYVHERNLHNWELGGGGDDAQKPITNVWILSNLTANIHYHLDSVCMVCKYGALIFRPNTDLIPSLQQAMWKFK
jgi:hypothetical protein